MYGSFRSAFWVSGVVLALVGAGWIVATGTFAFDVHDQRFIAERGGFGTDHNCLTAYVAAAQLAAAGAENPWDVAHYEGGGAPTSTHEAVRGVFGMDRYLYPPQFLLLPHAFVWLFGDFFHVRAAWYVFSVLLVLLAAGCVAVWCGALRDRPQLLWFPALFCVPTMHLSMQIGNVHAAVLALAMLGMLGMQSGRNVLGAACLGFAILMKIWPIVLLGYLFLQRRWRPVAYTVGAMLAYTALTAVVLGVQPLVAFFEYHVPRLASGDAFARLGECARPRVANMSAVDVMHKLQLMGFDRAPAWASLVGRIYTVLIGIFVLWIGLRRSAPPRDDGDRLRQACLWLALLTVAQLQSPFVPWVYGVISSLWLALLLAGFARGWQLAAVVLACVALAPNVPLDYPPGWAPHAAYTLLVLTAMLAASIVTAWRFSVPRTAEAPAPATRP